METIITSILNSSAEIVILVISNVVKFSSKLSSANQEKPSTSRNKKSVSSANSIDNSLINFITTKSTKQQFSTNTSSTIGFKRVSIKSDRTSVMLMTLAWQSERERSNKENAVESPTVCLRANCWT